MDLLYETRPDPLSHPARLGVSVLLDGRDPAPAGHCRVLELGCGDAAHLVPILHRFPEAVAVGVELDPVAAARARESSRAVGLVERFEVRAESLCDFDPSAHEPFDYVIAHGVYSWVSETVRADLLRLFSLALSPRGVGYLSFNARPGWAMRGELRSLLLEWAGGAREPGARVERARRGIAFLREALVDAETPASQLLAQEVESAHAASDAYLLAEHLAEHNRAFDLSEVAERATHAGLRVMGELARASADGIRELALVRHLATSIEEPDLARRTADLLLSRQLRRLALARSDVPPSPRRLSDVLPRLHLHARLRPLEDADGLGRFATESDAVLTVSAPPMRAALDSLAGRPRGTCPVAALLDHATPGPERRALLDGLATLVATGHARVWMSPVVPTLGERASKLAQWERAQHGWVSSGLHEAVELDAALSAALDDPSDAGTEDRETLEALGVLAPRQA